MRTYEWAKRRERKYGIKPSERYSRENMLQNAGRVLTIVDEDLSEKKFRIINVPTYEPWK